MNPTLARSYAFCERLARREAGNFYHAFRVLPAPERRAMCALYAVLRITDDLGDNPAPTAEKRAALGDWQRRFEGALAGDFSHPLHPALQDIVQKYRIPREYLHEVFAGVLMDLDQVRYATFPELYRSSSSPYPNRSRSSRGK